MKTFLFAMAVGAVAYLTAPAQAQQNEEFCLQSDQGNMNCAYKTMQQCEDAKKAASNTGTCVRNPKK